MLVWVVTQLLLSTKTKKAQGGAAGDNLSLLRGEIEFWFRSDVDFDNDATTRVLFALGDYANPPNLVLAKTDRLRFTLTTATRGASVESPPNHVLWHTHEWAHIRATWDTGSAADSLQVFVNGLRVDEGGAAGGWSLEGGNAPSQFFLGSADAGGTLPASGVFDSVIVRDRRQAWEAVNTAPELAPLTTHWLAEGEPLSFTATAVDAEAHALTWSLDPGAPPGATINSATGAFSYTPAPGTAPGYFDFHVRVTDDGVPNMSDTSRVIIGVVGSNPPVITNLTPASQSAPRTGTAVIGFDWTDADGDITILRVVSTNPLGVRSSDVPAFALNMKGQSGQATLELAPGDLPYGLTSYSARLVDSRGNESAAVNFQLTVAGEASGGSAPVINSAYGESFYVIRPAGPLDVAQPSFVLNVTDADQDARRLRIKLTVPGGASETTEIDLAQLNQELTGQQWQAKVRGGFKFRNTSSLGSYAFQFTVIDANGNASAPVAANISLTLPIFGAQRTPIIEYQSETTGRWGDRVLLAGTFPQPPTETVTVELGGQECEVTVSSWSQVEFIIPEGAVSGPIIVRSNRGSETCSAEIFTIIPEVRIFALNPPYPEIAADALAPADAPPRVVEGTDYPYYAKTSVPVADGGGVIWYVNEIPGGNLAVGTIDGDGVYHAPDVVNEETVVRVTAKLIADPTVSDGEDLIIVPRPIPPGGGLVRAAAGGVVRAYDGRSRISIPPNALGGNMNISIATMPNMQFPAPRPGKRVLGGVTLQPTGLIFQQPATLLIPLARRLVPGSTKEVLYYHTGTGQYQSEGIMGTVLEDGCSISCQISHFSAYVVDDEESAGDGPLAPPTLASALPVPAGGYEGATVPIKFFGTNLGDDLKVEVYNEFAQPAPEISAGPVYASADGASAGCELHIGVLPTLDEGEGHIYTVRLVRLGAGHADLTFSVAGLDELILGSSSVINLSNEPPRLFSAITIPEGALVRVNAGSLQYSATGPIVVAGRIEANGRHGEPGDSRAPGGAGSEGGEGGFGQDRPPGSVFLVPGVEWDRATAINQGKDGNAVDDSVSKPAGYGGAAGLSVELDIGGLVTKLIVALSSGGFAIVEVAREIISVGNAISDLSEASPMGRRGLGASRFSEVGQDATGGGGGGGGGAFQLGFVFLGNGVTFTVDGGGGGAGGDGGRSVSLRSGASVTVTGMIDTHGGHGGDGATTASFRVVPSILGIKLPTIASGDGCPCFPGGGGGGGRGARINLIGNSGVYAAHGSLVHYGGNGGQTGFVMVNPEEGEMRLGAHRNSLADGPALGVEKSGPVFDPAHFRVKVTDRRVLRTLGLRRVYAPGVAGGGLLTSISIYTSYASPPPSDANYDPDEVHSIPFDEELNRYDGVVLLHEGFNTMKTGLDEPTTILVISSDTDGDGLSDGDEIDLGTDPNDSDSDDDGLTDGQEIISHLDPNDSDSDDDGISDGDEINIEGTDPRKFDTDDDGFSDSAEIALGSSPLLGYSKPERVPPNTLLVAVQMIDGTHLGVVDMAHSRVAILGRPADGFGFGMACDTLGDIYTLSGSRLLIYDPIANSQTEVGTLSGGVLGGPLAYNPEDGMLYTVQVTGGPAPETTGQILRIDPATAAVTPIGGPLPTRIHSLAFTWDGKLYCCQFNPAGGDDLLEVDPATGSVVQNLGQSGKSPLRGLAISRDQVLYAAQPANAESGEVWSLGAATAAPTSVLPTSLPVFDLTVAPLPPPGLVEIQTVDFEGANIPHIEIGNFNGDAFPDMVKVQDDYPEVRIDFIIGSATGDFTATEGIRLPSNPSNLQRPAQLATGDLNGDGITDVVVPSTGETGKTVVLLSQTSMGIYVEHTTITLTHPGIAWAVGVASINSNADSHLDIVISTSAGMLVLTNNGTGASFTTASTLALGYLLSFGDLNHDSFIDLVSTGKVYLGNGDGSFDAPVPLGGTSGNNHTIGDINGDGHPDIVFGIQDYENGINSLEVRLGDGSGAFPTALSHPADFAGDDLLLLHDFDGDGTLDVLAGNYETGIRAYFRAGTPQAKIYKLYPPFSDLDLLGASAVTAGNVVGDPDSEIVIANQYNELIHIFKIGHPFRE